MLGYKEQRIGNLHVLHGLPKTQRKISGCVRWSLLLRLVLRHSGDGEGEAGRAEGAGGAGGAGRGGVGSTSAAESLGRRSCQMFPDQVQCRCWHRLLIVFISLWNGAVICMITILFFVLFHFVLFCCNAINSIRSKSFLSFRWFGLCAEILTWTPEIIVSSRVFRRILEDSLAFYRDSWSLEIITVRNHQSCNRLLTLITSVVCRVPKRHLNYHYHHQALD